MLTRTIRCSRPGNGHRWATGCWHALVAALALASVIGATVVPAAVTSREKVLAEPRDDKTLIYFIRPMKFVGGGRTMFIYADETFLGVLENNSYTFAYVEPGKRLLWLNWARVTKEIEAEPGSTRYFWIYDHFNELTGEEGRRRVQEAGLYVTPNPKESQTAQRHIAERYEKALSYMGVDTSRTSGPKDRGAKAERRVANWPQVDLSPYESLFIEDFVITDPKAAERKNQDYVQTAPRRLADMLAEDLSARLSEQVRREAGREAEHRTLVLHVDVTRYRPALYGKGSAAYLNFDLQLIDGASGKTLARVTEKRGSGYGIDRLEGQVVREISAYLEKCRGDSSPGN